MIQNNYYKVDNKLNKKIALFADIHYSDIFNLKVFDKIIANLNDNKPDFICIPGDIIDNGKELTSKILKPFQDFFEELSKIAPVIISIGNHDFVYEKKKKTIYVGIKHLTKAFNNKKNIYLLDNDIIEIDGICFIGLTNSFEYYYSGQHENLDLFTDEIKLKLYNKIDKSKYNILLCHSPINIIKDEVINSEVINNVDLILSGHMHNGMIPFIIDKISKKNRGLYGPFGKLFPKYARGKITKEVNGRTINLIISGGIIKISKTQSRVIRPINKLYQINIEYIEI